MTSVKPPDRQLSQRYHINMTVHKAADASQDAGIHPKMLKAAAVAVLSSGYEMTTC